MDAVDYLIRGVLALLILTGVVLCARIRFRAEQTEGGPGDIGLD